MKKLMILILFILSGIFNCDNSTEIKPWPDRFKNEEITFESDGLTLEGTLTIPTTSSKVAAIVIASGGGLDRDGIYESNPDIQLPVYKTWAETISSENIAVLRYDQRLLSPNIDVLQVTLGDRINDIISAISYLKTRSEIDTNKIFIVGHSQGGCIVPIAAQSVNNISGVVIINSDAIAIDTLVIERLKARGFSASYISDVINYFDSLRSNASTPAWGYANRGEIFWKEFIEYTENADSICISLRKPIFTIQCNNDEGYTALTRQKNITKWENISNESQLIDQTVYDEVTHFVLKSGTEETAMNVIHDIINWIKQF